MVIHHFKPMIKGFSLFILLTTFSLCLPARSQSLRPTTNGFSFGRSSGISSSFTQISRSEANYLVDIVTKNVSGNDSGIERFVPDQFYSTIDDQKSFSVLFNKSGNTSGSSETVIRNSAFSGFSNTIFLVD